MNNNTFIQVSSFSTRFVQLSSLTPSLLYCFCFALLSLNSSFFSSTFLILTYKSIQLYSCLHTHTLQLFYFLSCRSICSICNSANDFPLLGWLSLTKVLSVFSELFDAVSLVDLPTGAVGTLLIGNCPGTQILLLCTIIHSFKFLHFRLDSFIFHLSHPVCYIAFVFALLSLNSSFCSQHSLILTCKSIQLYSC